ncbi:ankyrin repeat-containing domain protein [Baffinella frigidus]|nr:ankyrin repeat-containing domain protein [Cryptophyta sp. CCMP2293]
MPTVSNNTLMGLTRVQSGAEHAGADAPPPPPPPAPAIRAPLHAAAVEGDVARVRYLLGLTEKKGLAVKIDGVDEVGRTALHVAAELGRRDVCEVLLDLEPGIVYAKAEGLQDCTALHSALSGIQTSGDMEEETARLLARGHDHIGVVTLLLDRLAEVTAKTRAGVTALHIAAGKGATTAVRALVAHGASLEARTITGRTPLFSAVANGQRTTTLLLLNFGADARAVPADGEGLLHVAAMSNFVHPNTIDWLLDAGATRGGREVDAKTPLLLAMENAVDYSNSCVCSEAPWWIEDEGDWEDFRADDSRFSKVGPGAEDATLAGISKADLDALKAKFGVKS